MEKNIEFLNKHNIKYKLLKSTSKEALKDGKSIVENLGVDSSIVYKTLVLKGKENAYVFVISVADNLDVSKARKLVGERKLSFVSVDQLLDLTGYEVGGCSPLGINENITITFDSTIKNKGKVIINAGKIGNYLEVNPHDIIKILNANVANISK